MFEWHVLTELCQERESSWTRQYTLSIGAMDEVSRKVQKASTHVACCVAADGAGVKGDVAGADVDAAALHSEKEMSEFNGAMDNRQRRFKKHKRLTYCARTRVEQEMSEKVHPSGRWIMFRRRALTLAVLPLMVQESNFSTIVLDP